MLESFQSGKFEYKKLSLEEQKQRGILGRLYGVICDTKNPTRNNRHYSLELWRKVFDSPLMKEKISNHCVFCELGHPADREEIDMEKICACLSEQPKICDDGKIYGVFDILDTINGRILKTLCDYGCNVGVSSRGSGDLITGFDGQEEVDPDTYNCETWDIVCVPAIKEARLKYVNESLDNTRYNKTLRTKLQETLNKADESDRKIMKEALDNLNININEEVEEEMPDEVLTDDEKKSVQIAAESVGDNAKINEDFNISSRIMTNILNAIGSGECAREWNNSDNSEKTFIELYKKYHDLGADAEMLGVRGYGMTVKLDKTFNLPPLEIRDEQTGETFTYKDIENENGPVYNAFDIQDESLNINEGRLSRNGLDMVFTVNNALSNEIDRTFGDRVKSREVLNKNEIKYVIPFDKDLEALANRIPHISKQIYQSFDNHPRNPRFKDIQDESLNEESMSTEQQYVNAMDNLFKAKSKKDKEQFKSDVDYYAQDLMNSNPKYQGKSRSAIYKLCKGIEDESLNINEADIYYDKGSYPSDNEFIEYVESKLPNVEVTSDTKHSGLFYIFYKGEFVKTFRYDKNTGTFDDAVDKINDILYYNTDIRNNANQPEMDDINEAQENTAVDNNEAMVEELQKLIKVNANLEQKVMDLQEQLSVCYAKESKSHEDAERYKTAVKTLAESSKIAKALQVKVGTLENKLNESTKYSNDLKQMLNEAKSQISASQSKSKLLKESINSKDTEMLKLKGSLTALKEDINIEKANTVKIQEALKTSQDNNKKLMSQNKKLKEAQESVKQENTKLTESIAQLQKDKDLQRNSYEQKVAKYSKLVEKYKKTTASAIDRYINLQAIRIGSSVNEVKNRLPESYSFKDIDKACEDLQSYKLNISKLPYAIKSKSINENVKISGKPSTNESILPTISGFDDDVDEDLKYLAGR